MKITILKSELLAILTQYFDQTITDVDISDPSISAPHTVHDLLSCHKLLIGHLQLDLGLPVDLHYTFPPDQKLSAVQALRAHVPGMSLHDAKWAIENWSQWIGFVAHSRSNLIQYGWNNQPLTRGGK